MTRFDDFQRLFNQMEQFSIGFTPFFREFRSSVNNNYPPHNIVHLSDDETLIELAVAGFKRSEISIEESRSEGKLTISGEKEGDEPEYSFKGIGTRSFSKVFTLADYCEVKSAKLEDGILSVNILRKLPDGKKVKSIQID